MGGSQAAGAGDTAGSQTLCSSLQTCIGRVALRRSILLQRYPLHLQQFGLLQPIPLAAMQDRRFHNIQYQGNYNFEELLTDYVQIWNNRATYVVQGYQHPPHYHSEYMEWFRSRSRRWITHEGAAAGQSRDIFEMITLQRDARASRIRTAARSS
ncbi:uncharacterized protein LOC126656060 [Mercurialis annua]|uniref:uncharacterized protein LOC126656060 n=1 Tax=Mercurialis annua TaxID=3986 RepID=UPI00215F6DAB|nr:uncharacterized protein LOC126656060 [Mercurialis annua]